MRSGEYKVSFVLPIFEHTKSVLFAGVEMSDLAEKLVALGLDVISGPPAAGSKFDLIVAGGIPRGKEEACAYFAALSGALADSGSVAFLLANRYGFSRLLRGARRGGANDDRGLGVVEPQSLGRYLRAIREHGFEAAGVHAPIPGVRNPSVIVPVADTRPLYFLLSHFPYFSTRQPVLALRIARILIRLGAHKHLMNWYIIIARKGGVRE